MRRFLRASFASILRLCSNADPDTLSGIEVTKRMLKWLKRGRFVHPYHILASRLNRNLDIIGEFWEQSRSTKYTSKPRVYVGSALLPNDYRVKKGSVRLILTSPPYCSAVEYDRRHLFEHYWLGFRNGDVQRLRQRYIGRRNYVYGNAERLAQSLPEPVRRELLRTLGPIVTRENRRARAIVQYFVEMSRWFRIVTDYLSEGGRLVLVVGDSTVRGRSVKTSRLLMRLAGPDLRMKTQFSYVLRNRSMQYSRWNEANVATENVLIFVKRKKFARSQISRND